MPAPRSVPPCSATAHSAYAARASSPVMSFSAPRGSGDVVDAIPRHIQGLWRGDRPDMPTVSVGAEARPRSSSCRGPWSCSSRRRGWAATGAGRCRAARSRGDTARTPPGAVLGTAVPGALTSRPPMTATMAASRPIFRPRSLPFSSREMTPCVIEQRRASSRCDHSRCSRRRFTMAPMISQPSWISGSRMYIPSSVQAMSRP